MSKKIGVVGGGTAGLHLGLYLRQHGIDVTIFTDRRPEDHEGMKLLNTVAHHHVTLEREDALECNHWPSDEYGYFGHYYAVSGETPLRFYGDLEKPSRAVDYRLYLPRLMEDFAARGGKFEFRRIEHEDVPEIAGRFDLLVICTGKGPFGQMFEPQPQHSPFDRPQRALCVGLFKGIAEKSTRAVTMHFAPGVGEIIEIPTLTFGGMAAALVIENHIGQDMEVLAKTDYAADPGGFMKLLFSKLAAHYPDLAERVDETQFDLANSARDILQGGVTPTVRNSHTFLDNGTLAIALGDVHAVVDPVLGQGANMASYAAVILGEEIVAQDAFDARFIEHVDARRQDRVLCATRWTNFMLQALGATSPDLLAFISALGEDRSLAAEFTENFNFPENQWDCFASPARARNWLSARAAKSANRAALAPAG